MGTKITPTSYITKWWRQCPRELLICVAATVELPNWATHVAVRNNGVKAEPVVWLDEINNFVDENPSSLSSHQWIASYNNLYWTFFSRDEVILFQQQINNFSNDQPCTEPVLKLSLPKE